MNRTKSKRPWSPSRRNPTRSSSSGAQLDGVGRGWHPRPTGCRLYHDPAAPANTAQPKIGSLAVLPLKNLSGDPAQEYLADGMTEALIARLSTMHDLRVISRTSVMQFKNPQISVPRSPEYYTWMPWWKGPSCDRTIGFASPLN